MVKLLSSMISGIAVVIDPVLTVPLVVVPVVPTELVVAGLGLFDSFSCILSINITLSTIIAPDLSSRNLRTQIMRMVIVKAIM
jgi:hypothetical protein